MSLEIDLIAGGKVGLKLPNPIMVASGFGGYGPELVKLGEEGPLGAIVTDPVSPTPWPGTGQPRLWDVPGGYILNTGNQNPGLRKVLKDHAPPWPNLHTPIIVRLCGASPEEHATVAARLEQVEGVAGLELDPFRSDSGEEEWGTGLDAIRAVRDSAMLPLLVALPLGAPPELAAWCVEEGADALALCAPPEGAWLSDELRLVQGKLYGTGLMPQTLDYMARVAGEIEAPLIGRGGIHTLKDVLAYFYAGARAVQIDSAILREPSMPSVILAELAAYMAQHELADMPALLAHLRAGAAPR